MTAGGVKAHFRRLQVAFLGEILSKPSLLVKAGAFLYTKFCVQVGFGWFVALIRWVSLRSPPDRAAMFARSPFRRNRGVSGKQKLEGLHTIFPTSTASPWRRGGEENPPSKKSKRRGRGREHKLYKEAQTPPQAVLGRRSSARTRLEKRQHSAGAFGGANAYRQPLRGGTVDTSQSAPKHRRTRRNPCHQRRKAKRTSAQAGQRDRRGKAHRRTVRRFSHRSHDRQPLTRHRHRKKAARLSGRGAGMQHRSSWAAIGRVERRRAHRKAASRRPTSADDWTAGEPDTGRAQKQQRGEQKRGTGAKAARGRRAGRPGRREGGQIRPLSAFFACWSISPLFFTIFRIVGQI